LPKKSKPKPPDLRGGAQIQKVINSAVNMAALQVRWPVVSDSVVWAKAHLLLASSGIEDYCRKP
jgi:hypothetical protein